MTPQTEKVSSNSVPQFESSNANAQDRIRDHNRDNAQQASEPSYEPDDDTGLRPYPSHASVTASPDDGVGTGKDSRLPKPKHPPLSKLTHKRIMSGIRGSSYTALGPFDTPKSGFTIFKNDSFDLVLAIDYNARGTRLVTASADRKLRVYDLNEESELCLTDTWSAHDAIISAVSYHYHNIHV